MSNVAVIGAQWGDEGKGKIVDWLSEKADVVIRFQGGHNAGHTLVVNNITYKLKLLPSGVVRKNKISIIGNGVVIDPWALLDEIKQIENLGIKVSDKNLFIAENAMLILPFHKELDGIREDSKDTEKIGTTRRGIGPAYEDKVGRRGIRVIDLANEKNLSKKIDTVLFHHNSIRKGLGKKIVDKEAVMKDLIKITYLPESFDNAFQIINDYTFDKHLQKDIYFLTDKQLEGIKKINENIEKSNNSKAYVFTTSSLESNLAILHARVLNDVIVPNEPFDIEVTLKNTGLEDISDHNLQLIINDLAVGQQVASLTSGDEKNIRFTTSIPGPGSYLGEIYSQSDDRNKDNKYHFNLKVPKEIKIAFLNIGGENNHYLNEAMAALNKNSNFYDATPYNMSNLSNEINKILKNDLIITTPSTIANHSNSDFMEYVYNGGHLLIFPNDKTTIDEYKSIINEFSETNSEMNELKLVKLSDAHQEINHASIVPKQIRELLSSKENNDRIIKIFNFYDLPFSPKETQMTLQDRSSVWNRHEVGDGIIDIFSFAMDLKWTNFPIKGSFLPLIHYLTHSSSKFNNNNGMLVNEKWTIPVGKHIPNKTMHELPNDKSEILNDIQNGKITTNKLRIPGQHKITIGSRIMDQVAVNLNASEFENNLSDDNFFSLKTSPNLSLINNNKSIEEQLDMFRNGRELWRLILYVIVVLLMIEMYLSSPLKKN